jgi:hypothetical protein
MMMRVNMGLGISKRTGKTVKGRTPSRMDIETRVISRKRRKDIPAHNQRQVARLQHDDQALGDSVKGHMLTTRQILE